MVERKRALERILVGERTRVFVSIVSCGIILANFVVSSSSMLRDFAPLRMTSTWLYAAAFICGFVLGIALDEPSEMFYGVGLMALIAVLVFSGVLVLGLTELLSNTAFIDIVLLIAFQQSFLTFIFICVFGYVGVFLSALLRLSVPSL